MNKITLTLLALVCAVCLPACHHHHHPRHYGPAYHHGPGFHNKRPHYNNNKRPPRPYPTSRPGYRW